MDNLLIFLCGLLYGVAIGAYIAWHHWLKTPPPPAIQTNLLIDQRLLDRIASAEVELWLAQRGLVWQPRGATFDPHRVKK